MYIDYRTEVKRYGRQTEKVYHVFKLWFYKKRKTEGAINMNIGKRQ